MKILYHNLSQFRLNLKIQKHIFLFLIFILSIYIFLIATFKIFTTNRVLENINDFRSIKYHAGYHKDLELKIILIIK